MEIMDLYGENEQRTGKTIRRCDPIPKGEYLLSSEVLVRHIDGDYLLVRRSPNKRVYPNFYEATAGGGALAGEDALACVRRELFEETGITSVVFNELAVTRDENCFCHSFFGVTNCEKDSIRLQESEVTDYKWVSEREFIDFINSDEVIDTQKARYAEHFHRMKYIK
ncbi:MAG: NUDIX domain-containing protein [Clostridia bacterium]|nr:NUDIX domain-containing protein [Clostridia bacterium]